MEFPNLHVGVQGNTVCTDNGRKIATTFGANKTEYAKAIAALPGLIDALELLLYGWDNSDLDHDVSGSFEIARTVLKKALD